MRRLRVHHIGFEVRNLEYVRLILEKYLGFHFEQYMELNDEKILFLVNDLIRIELTENVGIDENDMYQAHICFEVDCIQFIEELELSIIEGPIRMDNGWTSVFVEGENNEIIEFLKRN